MEPQIVTSIGAAAEYDFSFWRMFMSADLIVKGVILMLLGASIWCWAIIIEKSRRFRRLAAQADRFEEAFWSGGSLDDLYQRVAASADHPMAVLFSSAMREWRRSNPVGQRSGYAMGAKERLEKVMQVTVTREIERLERYLGFLATVGSTAPFVGLFGTVWGIMNSFQSIAVSHNTSLAVVAPGIAEALFATALGLIAAIPAVVAYNKFTNDLGRYANRLQGFAEEFSAFLSRQIDDRASA